MKKLTEIKNLLIKWIAYFDKEDETCPIGLKSLGLRVSYLNNVYKNKYSSRRFSGTVISPVSEKPLYFGT